MENRGLIAAVCSGRPPQQMLRFHMENKQCFQLSALPASTAQRWFRRTVITYQMHAPWDQNHVPLEWKWVWLTTTLQGKSHHWYSCIYLRLCSVEGIGGLCSGVCWHVRRIWPVWNFCFCSDDSFNSIIYMYFFFSSFHFHIFNKGK